MKFLYIFIRYDLRSLILNPFQDVILRQEPKKFKPKPISRYYPKTGESLILNQFLDIILRQESRKFNPKPISRYFPNTGPILRCYPNTGV